MFVLRYVPGTDLRDRRHAPTVPHYDDWWDAEIARLDLPQPELLEVVER